MMKNLPAGIVVQKLSSIIMRATKAIGAVVLSVG